MIDGGLVLKLIMTKILDWAKHNWLSLVLLLVVLYMFGFGGGNGPMTANRMSDYVSYESAPAGLMMAKSSSTIGGGSYYPQAAPVATDQRMVVQDTSLSMQVKEVGGVLTEIEKLATSMGGYMVDRGMNQPEGAASGNISIRVPTEKREETIAGIKAMGMKTVSENVYGNDVTDQYVDIQGRIDGLNKTKAKMQSLMDQAVKVDDLMNIQMQLNNIQEQIDMYLGRQKYLEQTAKLTRISVNLSTDELALPYTPDSAWRPAVVFKTAVRSMLGALRSVANSIIWLVVYIPVIAALLLAYWIVRMVWKKFKRN